GFDRVGAILYPTEERSHAVVIVLRPALERMVMAFGALHADAKEELGGRFRQAGGIARDSIIIRRRVGESAAAGGDDFVDDLIETVVLVDVVAQPFLEDVRPLDLNGLARRAEHV